MIIAVLKETYPGERRVALAPSGLAPLAKAGHEILIESGAGAAAGFRDSEYQDAGAKIIDQRDVLFAQGEIVLQVRGYGSNPEAGREDLKLMRAGQIFIGFMEPLGEPGLMQELAKTGAQCYSMELIPRITRAQSMDALSSMATLAGYKAVLLAAEALPKIFPMMMTAAGNLAPAKVFVIGVGVAGLQAIATARRLGAVVSAYDVRPAVKEQVESVGARFVELDLETEQSEGEGGYAKAEGEEFYRRQRAMMLKVVAENDVVITTAAVPGKKAPILVTEEMVMAMDAGSVIVDLAAERGGNCELTQPDRTVVKHGVTIIGLENLPSTIPQHASQMYSKNISTLLLHLIEKNLLGGQTEDEIASECLITHDGKVVHPRVNALLDEAAKS